MGINGPSLGAIGDVTWLYTITFSNQTTDALDEVVVFFQTLDGSIQSRSERNWGPGETRVFALSTCADTVSYSLGVFIGNTMVAKIPDQGNMTREMASQLNPDDRFLCEDSWRLFAG